MATLSSGVETIVEDQPTCVTLNGEPCSPYEEKAAVFHQIEQPKAKYDTIGTAWNAIHDPFINKLPPEIASHILCLSLTTLNNGDDDPNAMYGQWSIIRKDWAAPLKLGSVCCKWRQLAWSTPNLWTTVHIRIKPSMTASTAESLPGLLREWLGRSGALPLTVYFFPYHEFTNFALQDDLLDINPTDTWTDTLDVAAGLVIGILNFYSGRWRNLYLKASADMLVRFSGSAEPKQLVSLELSDTMADDSPSLAPQKFMMESELSPTHLKLTYFRLTSISLRWDNITHATLSAITDEETLDFLRRASNLEYFYALSYDSSVITIQTPIFLPQLRSLDLGTRNLENILGAITLPSLKEWTQKTYGEGLPVAAIISFLERSGCPLKVLNLETAPPPRDLDLISLFQALHSLEYLCLRFRDGVNPAIVMDDILTRIFCSVPRSSDIRVDAPFDSFLPNLRSMEYYRSWEGPPLSWDRIPELYHQGHRRSLTLKCSAFNRDIRYQTALRLLQLVDEGVDLQIPHATQNGDFLENFRNVMREGSP